MKSGSNDPWFVVNLLVWIVFLVWDKTIDRTGSFYTKRQCTLYTGQVNDKWIGIVEHNPLIGLVSICGCCSLRVGQRKLRPEVSVSSEEYKKQFQTSEWPPLGTKSKAIAFSLSGNFSASEYCNWRKKERVHHGRNVGEEEKRAVLQNRK